MSKGMDFDQLYPGRFLKAGEFQGLEVTLKIASINVEELEGDDKKKKPKVIFSFERPASGRKIKELVVCKTNGLCLRAMFGRDSGEWIGKRVTFRPEMVDSFGAKELAIRVCGSPDIPADITFELKLARKSPRSVTLKRTAVKAQAGAPRPAPAPAPQPDTRSPADFAPEAEPPTPGDEHAPGGGQ